MATTVRVTQVAKLVDQDTPAALRVTQAAKLVDRQTASALRVTQVAKLVDYWDPIDVDTRRRASFF